MIDRFAEDYKTLLNAIDHKVKELISSGSDMAGIALYYDSVSKIKELHDSLVSMYEIIFKNQALLDMCGSERIKQLGHEPLPICSVIDIPEAEPEMIENAVLSALRSHGYGLKEHWIIKDIILAEIEYMLDALRILVEPSFIPLQNEIQLQPSEGGVDRYVPSSIKVAVWRRDNGKCIQCGSREKLEYDHIIPISKGGSNTERNVQLLCEKCNRQKSAKIQ